MHMKKLVFLLAAALLIAGCVSNNPPAATATPSPSPTLSPQQSLDKLDEASKKLFSSNGSFSYSTKNTAVLNGIVVPYSNLTVYWRAGDYRFVEIKFIEKSASNVVFVGGKSYVCKLGEGLDSCSVWPKRDRTASLLRNAVLGRLAAVAAGKPADAVTVEYVGAGIVGNRSCDEFKVAIDGSKVDGMVIDSNAYLQITSNVCLDAEYGVALSSSSSTRVKVVDPSKLKEGQAAAYASIATSENEELVSFSTTVASSDIKAPA